VKKYRVVFSFCGAIGIQVGAENEEQAEIEAQKIVDKFSSEEFLSCLDPQLEEVNVEEIK